MRETRLAGLDVGDKRIGVAVGDSLGLTAQALGVVERHSNARDCAAIQEMLAEYEIGAYVAGLPIEMSGKEGVQADRARHFCGHLAKATGLPIHFQDERMTSLQSERLLVEAGVKRSKRKDVIDKMAAALILQAWLDSQGTSL
jgi:putative Holliday junction resolvase